MESAKGNGILLHELEALILLVFIYSMLASHSSGAKISLPTVIEIKFYWNAAVPIYLAIVAGCFQAVVRVATEKPKLFTIWLFAEQVCRPWIYSN